jgi:hypothetical protein
MPAEPVTIIGTYLSPYVRKALVCLDLKGIDYRIDPIVPFFGNEQFTRISPLRRIPALIDESVETPIGKHRDALIAVGAPVSPTTFGTGSPRRGVPSI